MLHNGVAGDVASGHRAECILNPLYPAIVLSLLVKGNDIEPDAVCAVYGMPAQKHTGGTLKLCLLAQINRPCGRCEAAGFSVAYLDHDDTAALPHDEIYLSLSATKISLDQDEPVAAQNFQRLLFGQVARLLRYRSGGAPRHSLDQSNEVSESSSSSISLSVCIAGNGTGRPLSKRAHASLRCTRPSLAR